jgi:hypothetical protein
MIVKIASGLARVIIPAVEKLSSKRIPYKFEGVLMDSILFIQLRVFNTPKASPNL